MSRSALKDIVPLALWLMTSGKIRAKYWTVLLERYLSMCHSIRKALNASRMELPTLTMCHMSRVNCSRLAIVFV